MRTFLKLLWRLPLILLLLAVIAGIAGFFWLRTSLPQTDGTVTVAGLDAPVEVVRDANAVPHIFASSERDAAFALGFVHAQDRLAQMEIMRRTGQGRLSEVAGKAALKADKAMRTLGLYRRAQAAYFAISPEVRPMIDAYAAGVNAYLDSHEGAWPPEFYLLGIEPEPWKPADTLVWSRLMAVQLATNWASEAMRARFIQALGAKATTDLWPAYPENAPVTIADARELAAAIEDLPLGDLAAAWPWEMISQGASNQWVVSGERSASGLPLLANDPHLGLSAPSIWYLARIDIDGRTVTGATAPGVPLIVLGHNDDVAWGFTTSYIDTDDLFVERLTEGKPGYYDAPDGPRPFDTREEVIEVRFGDPVTIEVRETRHGPVLEGVLGLEAEDVAGGGHVLALQAPWLRERDRTAEALYRMNRAADAEAFVDALEQFEAPPQNIVFADTQGTTGFYTPGLLPIRPLEGGYLPTPGWSDDYDWEGYIPFDELPHVIDPPAGTIINANNKMVGDDYPYPLSEEWAAPYRARRIADLLAESGRVSPDDFTRMQMDTKSYAARALLPLLEDADIDDPRGVRAADMLRAWDGSMDRNRPEPLIFAAWVRELNRRLYGDELGEELMESYWGFRADVVLHMTGDAPRWCNDVNTEKTESCGDQVAAALDDALAWIAERHGDDMTEWRWGDEHYALLRNRTFDFLPVIRGLTNLTLPADGGAYTVNRADFRVSSEEAPFADRHAAGYRAVYDMSALDETRFVIAGGQSGNPFSDHYDNLLERWRDGEYIRIAGNRDEVGENATGVLSLEPGGR